MDKKDCILFYQFWCLAANKVQKTLSKVATSPDQENLVEVAKDIILKTVIPEFLTKENQAFNDIQSMAEELEQSKRNEDVEKIEKETNDLLDKALVEKEKATDEAATSNPIE